MLHSKPSPWKPYFPSRVGLPYLLDLVDKENPPQTEFEEGHFR
jgi:hypothetical protein